MGQLDLDQRGEGAVSVRRGIEQGAEQTGADRAVRQATGRQSSPPGVERGRGDALTAQKAGIDRPLAACRRRRCRQVCSRLRSLGRAMN